MTYSIKIIAVIGIPMLISQTAKSQLIDEARELIETKRYNSAEMMLEKSIPATDQAADINYLLVKTYLEQEKITEAREFVNTHLNPADLAVLEPMNRITYARYLLKTGKQTEAADIFSSILSDKKNQKNVPLLIAMSEVAIEENGDALKALGWLDLAEKKSSKQSKIEILRGLAYRKLGDASKSYLAYQDALKKDPGSVRAHYLLAKIFIAQKNPDVYMEHLMKVMELDFNYAPVLKELYDHYYYRDVQKAKYYLTRYIANTDYSLQNEYSLTDMLYLTGEYKEAISAARQILQKENDKAQPRLYKLIAYSLAGAGDSLQATGYMNNYFEKEDTQKLIAADYRFMAQLTARDTSKISSTIHYYINAAMRDTISSKRAADASALAGLYKKTGDFASQAEWLGKLYQWKDKTNNIDLFNWGLAWYMANNYQATDSVFSLYTTRYPQDIFGYYWRALANAAIDTAMKDGLAIPFYNKVAELGETNATANKKMLLKAYGYLGGYEANISKNFPVSLSWFEKYAALEENAEVRQYIDVLKKWIAEKKE